MKANVSDALIISILCFFFLSNLFFRTGGECISQEYLCESIDSTKEQLELIAYHREDAVSAILLFAKQQMNLNYLMFHLIMYYTENIHDHSLYSFANNYLYTRRRRQIQSEFLNPVQILRYLPLRRDDSNHTVEEEWDKQDVRWNKVIILYNLISDLLEILPDHQHDYRYLVWLDSDLIIANHSFSFTEVVRGIERDKNYPYDIIISREIDPANGIANTGCMLIRVSRWARSFLLRWWKDWNRQDGMDQHVFEALYRQLSRAEQLKHVLLLDATAINSQFPGLVNHNISLPILHLAGESNFIRREIFLQCWQKLCSTSNFDFSISSAAVTNQVYLDTNLVYPPLGISRATLNSVDYIATHRREWHSILHEMQQELIFMANKSSWAEEILSVSSIAQSLQNWQYRVREAQQSLSKFVCSSAYKPSIDSDYAYIRAIKSVDISGNLQKEEKEECISLKEMFYDETVKSLLWIYQRYKFLLSVRLDHEDGNHKSNIAPVNSVKLLLVQSTLDAALEVLTVLEFDHQEHHQSIYLQIVEETLSLVMVVQSQINVIIEELQERYHSSSMVVERAVTNKKVMLYYEYKLLEYRALYLEDVFQHPKSGNRDKTMQVLAYEQAVIAWKQCFEVWCTMSEIYKFFGTGNAIAHANDEGIATALRIAYLLCSTASTSQSNDVDLHMKEQRQQGCEYLEWIRKKTFGDNDDQIDYRRYEADWQHLNSLACQCHILNRSNTDATKQDLSTKIELMSPSPPKNRKKFRKKKLT